MISTPSVQFPTAAVSVPNGCFLAVPVGFSLGTGPVGARHTLLFSDNPKRSQVSAARAGGLVTFPSSLPAAPLAEPADKPL